MLDLSNVTAQGEPLASGKYAVIVEKAEVADTKSGGKMIKAQFKVIDGPGAGRFIFDQFNIQNANPQATQIGLGQLKGMMKAFGHPNPNKLESCAELLGLKGSVTVKLESDPQYGEQVRVKGYGALTTASAPAGAAAFGDAPAAAQPAAQQATGNPFA